MLTSAALWRGSEKKTEETEEPETAVVRRGKGWWERERDRAKGRLSGKGKGTMVGEKKDIGERNDIDCGGDVRKLDA